MKLLTQKSVSMISSGAGLAIAITLAMFGFSLQKPALASTTAGQSSEGSSHSAREIPVPAAIAPQVLAQRPEVPISVDHPPDFKFLAKAFKKNLTHPRYQTQSTLFIRGETQGIEFSTRANITSITEAPGPFRSTISFVDPQGQLGREYWVISDGAEVTVYDREQNRYSTLSVADFSKSDDDFLTGLLASLSLEVQANGGAAALGGLSEEELAQIFREQLNSSNGSVAFGSTQVEGKNYSSLGFEDSFDGLSMTLLLDPVTAEAGYLYLSGQAKGLDLLLQEQIHSRTPMSTQSDEVFRFVPPAGATWSAEAISIDPF